MGKVAASFFIQTNLGMTALRGDFYEFQGTKVMPTFHPAYLMRNPKDKWLTWDDMQKVLKKLE